MANIYYMGVPYGGRTTGGGGGTGTVQSVSVNGGTAVLPDISGNVDLNVAIVGAYTSSNTLYIATLEDGDEVTYPND